MCNYKVRKGAKTRNRYNQAPHLTQDTKVEVTTSQLDMAYESFYWPFQGDVSFIDPFCILCFTVVFNILTCLFLAALWSPAGKGLTFWASCVWCFLVFLSLSHMVSRVRCWTWLFRFLIFAFFFTFITFLRNTCLMQIGTCHPLYSEFSVYLTNIGYTV